MTSLVSTAIKALIIRDRIIKGLNGLYKKDINIVHSEETIPSILSNVLEELRRYALSDVDAMGLLIEAKLWFDTSNKYHQIEFFYRENLALFNDINIDNILDYLTISFDAYRRHIGDVSLPRSVGIISTVEYINKYFTCIPCPAFSQGCTLPFTYDLLRVISTILYGHILGYEKFIVTKEYNARKFKDHIRDITSFIMKNLFYGDIEAKGVYVLSDKEQHITLIKELLKEEGLHDKIKKYKEVEYIDPLSTSRVLRYFSHLYTLFKLSELRYPSRERRRLPSSLRQVYSEIKKELNKDIDISNIEYIIKNLFSSLIKTFENERVGIEYSKEIDNWSKYIGKRGFWINLEPTSAEPGRKGELDISLVSTIEIVESMLYSLESIKYINESLYNQVAKSVEEIIKSILNFLNIYDFEKFDEYYKLISLSQWKDIHLTALEYSDIRTFVSLLKFYALLIYMNKEKVIKINSTTINSIIKNINYITEYLYNIYNSIPSSIDLLPIISQAVLLRISEHGDLIDLKELSRYFSEKYNIKSKSEIIKIFSSLPSIDNSIEAVTALSMVLYTLKDIMGGDRNFKAD